MYIGRRKIVRCYQEWLYGRVGTKTQSNFKEGGEKGHSRGITGEQTGNNMKYIFTRSNGISHPLRVKTQLMSVTRVANPLYKVCDVIPWGLRRDKVSTVTWKLKRATIQKCTLGR